MTCYEFVLPLYFLSLWFVVFALYFVASVFLFFF